MDRFRKWNPKWICFKPGITIIQDRGLQNRQVSRKRSPEAKTVVFLGGNSASTWKYKFRIRIVFIFAKYFECQIDRCSETRRDKPTAFGQIRAKMRLY